MRRADWIRAALSVGGGQFFLLFAVGVLCTVQDAVRLYGAPCGRGGWILHLQCGLIVVIVSCGSRRLVVLTSIRGPQCLNPRGPP